MHATLTEPNLTDLLHEGRYLPTDAARLVRLPAATVRRWLATSPSFDPTQAPVVRHDETPRGLVSFLDLVELHMARRLLDEGFKMRTIGRALREAARIHHVDHPLARRRFLVDADRLWLPLDGDGDGPVMELDAGGQLWFQNIVRDHARTIEFDPSGLATRLWVDGLEAGIVLDPSTGWGRPFLPSVRLHTAALYNLWCGERGNYDRVASMYEVDVDAVRRAVEFEAQRQRKAA